MPSDPPSSDPPSSDRPPRQLPARNEAYICEERANLLRGYSAAARSYADKVEALAVLITSGTAQGVSEARRHCRTAWDETEQSRLSLYRHEADHQCDRAPEVPSACG
ncbi:MAG TPA: hypothetical protein VFW44_11235 [Bryobacteraceae bacterium]|nr:hypothetical protein [Bryobacteraceae bacterium]